MAVDVRVPRVVESVKEARILKWHKKTGDQVQRDQIIVELETDKASVEIVAETSGRFETLKKEGDTVLVGETIARLDPAATGSAQVAAPAVTAAPAPVAASSKSAATADMGPAARRLAAETNVDASQVAGTGKGGRVTKADLMSHSDKGSSGPTPAVAKPAATPAASPLAAPRPTGARTERREPMTLLRKRIAERLVHAQSTAAILTTFNEVDMTAVMALRAQYKEAFKEKYGVSLGFMGIFVKAAIEALKAFPAINGFVDGGDVIYHDYFDIGVAVSSDRGLVVPVVRNADSLSVSETEAAIGNFARKARDGKITVDEITGGTFTVSNGGVFGSLLSTPILNPPQSGILGMHKIQDRPMAVNGQVLIRPMMYLALSYDHRIVDGREAVQFLVKIKECVEDPARILLGV